MKNITVMAVKRTLANKHRYLGLDLGLDLLVILPKIKTHLWSLSSRHWLALISLSSVLS